MASPIRSSSSSSSSELPPGPPPPTYVPLPPAAPLPPSTSNITPIKLGTRGHKAQALDVPNLRYESNNFLSSCVDGLAGKGKLDECIDLPLLMRVLTEAPDLLDMGEEDREELRLFAHEWRAKKDALCRLRDAWTTMLGRLPAVSDECKVIKALLVYLACAAEKRSARKGGDLMAASLAEIFNFRDKYLSQLERMNAGKGLLQSLSRDSGMGGAPGDDAASAGSRESAQEMKQRPEKRTANAPSSASPPKVKSIASPTTTARPAPMQVTTAPEHSDPLVETSSATSTLAQARAVEIKPDTSAAESQLPAGFPSTDMDALRHFTAIIAYARTCFLPLSRKMNLSVMGDAIRTLENLRATMSRQAGGQHANNLHFAVVGAVMEAGLSPHELWALQKMGGLCRANHEIFGEGMQQEALRQFFIECSDWANMIPRLIHVASPDSPVVPWLRLSTYFCSALALGPAKFPRGVISALDRIVRAMPEGSGSQDLKYFRMSLLPALALAKLPKQATQALLRIAGACQGHPQFFGNHPAYLALQNFFVDLASVIDIESWMSAAGELEHAHPDMSCKRYFGAVLNLARRSCLPAEAVNALEKLEQAMSAQSATKDRSHFPRVLVAAVIRANFSTEERQALKALASCCQEQAGHFHGMPGFRVLKEFCVQVAELLDW